MLTPVLGRSDVYTFFNGTLTNLGTVPPNSVALGGYVYPIDLKQYRHSSQDTLRDGAVVSSEASDSLFNANGAWSRYRYTWHEGADQEVADFRKDSTEFRFADSVGVDPWTQGELCLLKDTTLLRAVTNGARLCFVNDKLYLADGTALYYTTNLSTWTTCTPPGGTIQALASDGYDLFVGTTTLVTKYTAATPATPTNFSPSVTGNCSNLAFVANRLLAGVDNVLWEVQASGTHTTIKTHYQPVFRWNTIFSVGSRIYCGGTGGSRSELYSLTTDSTGSLVQSAEAAPIPPGELLRNGYAYAGLVLLCTSKGIRLAQPGGDGTLTYGPLIDALGDVRAATFDGRFAYVTWTNHPSTGQGVARVALDTTVDVLQPAYASDIYKTAGSAGAVTDINRFLNKTVFIVDGVGLYAESDNYLTSGYLNSGRIYFGTVESKAITHLRVVFDPLAAGHSVTASIYNERDTLINTSLQDTTSTDVMDIDLDGAIVRYVTMRITLKSAGTTTCPCVKYWRLQAYPIPPAVMQWVVPLLLYSRTIINNGMGQERTMAVLDECDRIRTWFQSKETINYQEGDRAYRVRVDAFELQPTGWTDDGGFFEHVLIVRLVSA